MAFVVHCSSLVRDVIVPINFDDLDGFNPEIFDEWNLKCIDFKKIFFFSF